MVKLKRVHSILESYLLTFEGKKDLEDLKSHLGDSLFDAYMKIRDRIPKEQNQFKDFQKLKKMDKKDVQDFVNSFQSKSGKKKQDKTEGAKKIFENDGWVVYRITTYPAAQLYGKGTKWCITGRYPGHEGKGEEYFNNYIEEENLDNGYYFFINKEDPYDKYCVLKNKEGDIVSIWNAEDSEMRDVSSEELPTYLPEVKGLEGILEYLEDNGATNFSLESRIKEELSKQADDIDLTRLERWLDALPDNEGFDTFYKMITDDPDKTKVFDLLSQYVFPTNKYIRSYYICEPMVKSLCDKIKSRQTQLYTSEQVFSLLYSLIKDYGFSENGQKYDIAKDPELLSLLLSNSGNKKFNTKDFIQYLIDDLHIDVKKSRTFWEELEEIYDINDLLYYYINEEGYFDVIKAIVESGADLNYVYNNSKDTLFMKILDEVRNLDSSDIKWMLSKGANKKIKNAKGKTAKDFVEDQKLKSLLS